MKQFIRIAIILLEMFVIVNAILIVFLMTTWMEDHTFATSASEIDWWIIAGQKFLVAIVLSVVASILLLLVNRPLFIWSGFTNERLPYITAKIMFISLFISSLIGAIIFAVEKPYI